MNDITSYTTPARQLKLAVITLILVTVAILVAACSADATPTPTAPPDPLEAGEQLFRTAGCAVCHGQDALGTGAGPALPGHTEDQVLRQVRSPVGRMPAFSASQVSDEELDLIADYIISLGGGNGHVEPTTLGEDEVLVMHHWMALDAIQTENLDEADHHIQHIISAVQDDEHLNLMEEIAAAVSSGDLHDAEHLLEELLVGTVEPSLGADRLHAQLAFAALVTEDVADALHQLDHVLSVSDDSVLLGMAELAIEQLDAGDVEEARHIVQEALDRAPHDDGH